MVYRLAAIQDKRPVAVPLVNTKLEVNRDDWQLLMLSINSLLPDHSARLRALQVRITLFDVLAIRGVYRSGHF